MNDKLILRTVNSPFITPYEDITKGNVLSHTELDNNFIFLKGNIIYTAETNGSTVTLKRHNGDNFSFSVGSDYTFTGGTVSGDTFYLNGLSATTFSASTYLGLPQDAFTTDAYLSGKTIVFDSNKYGSNFYNVDLTPILSGNSMYVSNVYLTANIPQTISHPFNTDDVIVQIKTSTGELTIIDVDNYQIGSIDVTTNVSDNYKIIIIGNTDVLLISGGTDSYTNNTYLSGNTIVFDNNQYGPNFYNVDLTPILSGFSSNDTYVTGGTYSNGNILFTNNQGNTFQVLGLNTGYTLTSSAITNTLGYTPLSASTDTYVTGFTYNNNTFTISRNNGLSPITQTLNTVTGLTVNGDLSTTTIRVTNNAAIGRIPVSDGSGNLTLTDYQPSVVPGTTQINNYLTSGSTNYFSPIAIGNGYVTSTTTANYLYVSPFVLTEDITITSLSLEVIGVLGTTALVGIYELDSNKLPTNPVVNSSLVNVSSLGVKDYTLITPYTLLRNKWYGLAILPTNNMQVRGPIAKNYFGGSISSAIMNQSYRGPITPLFTTLPINPVMTELNNNAVGIFWRL